MAATIPVVVPNCKWAQRTNCVMLSIVIPNLDPALSKVTITETSFSFQYPRPGSTGIYELKFDFFGTVDPSKCRQNYSVRDVDFLLIRKEEGSYWDRLNKGPKITSLKCDWDRWKDEFGPDSDREAEETEKKYKEISNTWGDGIGDLIKQFNSTGQLAEMENVDWLAHAEKAAQKVIAETEAEEKAKAEGRPPPPRKEPEGPPLTNLLRLPPNMPGMQC